MEFLGDFNIIIVSCVTVFVFYVVQNCSSSCLTQRIVGLQGDHIFIADWANSV